MPFLSFLVSVVKGNCLYFREIFLKTNHIKEAILGLRL